MRREGLATLLIGGAALVAVAAGLWLIGGPESGRAEHRDRVRMDDLRTLGDFVRCVADSTGGVLPDTLAPAPACGDEVHLADPYTGAAYRYRIMFEGDGKARFRVCATFEAPRRLTNTYLEKGSFERETGCAAFSYES